MTIRPISTAAFRKFIRHLGLPAIRSIYGGEPPITYVKTVKLGTRRTRVFHALILVTGTHIVTPRWCSPKTGRGENR